MILALHPHLEKTLAEAEQVDGENCWAWLQTWKDRYGDEITVPLMNIAEHERIDPRSELIGMVHPDKIITIDIDISGGKA